MLPTPASFSIAKLLTEVSDTSITGPQGLLAAGAVEEQPDATFKDYIGCDVDMVSILGQTPRC